MHQDARRVAFLLLAALAVVFAVACRDGTGIGRRPAPLYVAIAASDGVGTGARDPATDGWVARVRAGLPAGWRLANLSIPSMQVQQAIDQVLPVAVDLDPAVVTIWLGVNDFAAGANLETFAAGLDALLTTLTEQTGARVFVANLPDLTLLPAFRTRPAADLQRQVEEWNRAIAATAAAHGTTLVDLYGGWRELRDHPEYISRDGLHPSSAGHERIAALFLQAIGDPNR